MALGDGVLAQILDGELIALPRPSLEHSLASSALGALLGGSFGGRTGGPGGWWILYEPELHFGEDVLVPDLAGWRRERMPQPPSGPWATLAPDWICEVLSPSTATIDRVRKLAIYAREGVPHAWLVDPLARTLEVFRLEPAGWLRVGAFGSGSGAIRVEPFAAIDLDLDALWPAGE